VVAEDQETLEFLREKSLWPQVEFAIKQLEAFFPGAKQASFSLMFDPEDEDSQGTLALYVDCQMPRREFRDACHEYLTCIRHRHERLYMLLAVLRA